MLWLLLAMLLLALPGCDKLEDSDLTAEAIVGRWAFTYKTSQQLDFELSYKFVTFLADGTCTLSYQDGQLSGSYRASEAVIRIEGTLEDGKNQVMLWKVVSMSPYTIVTDYDLQLPDGRLVDVRVTLERL